MGGPDGFRTFVEPGYARTIYALSVRAIDARRTLLTGTMRTATTDESARAWFRRYWTMGGGPGGHVLVQGVIDIMREMAEQATETGATGAAREAEPARQDEPEPG